ncbi:hypothetical protein ACFLU6_06070 [Acidobacteriota bacterium]
MSLDSDPKAIRCQSLNGRGPWGLLSPEVLTFGGLVRYLLSFGTSQRQLCPQVLHMLSQLTTIRSHIRFHKARRFRLLCFLALIALQPTTAAEAVTSSEELTETQTVSLAERFAPVLVFHPDEQFFPSSPLFSLSQGPLDECSIVDILGTPEQRREKYLSLTLHEKARTTTVYYRVHKLPRQTGEAVVIEYWFYYVWNTYFARPGLFPFWFDGSHPNDMEQVRVVLELDPEGHGSWTEVQGRRVRLETIYVTAHEGNAPANRYDFPKGESQNGKAHVLVELGSHAGGTDTDRDGLFTSGDDGESGHKILWGVRDRGYTWSRYNPDYMDQRNSGNEVLFCFSGGDFEGDGGLDACPRDSFSYRLAPVDELYRHFDQLALSSQEKKQIFENNVSWVKRLFGKSNGNSEKLVLPPDTGPDEKTVAIGGFASTERGWMVGGTTLISDPGFFVGGRYSFLHGVKFLPDLMLNAEGVVTIQGQGVFSTSFLLAYPIDAMTKVFGGVGLVTDFERRQSDWTGGLEVRLGGTRVSIAGRTMGSLTHSALDFRLYYFF